ncbi:hypothetical protein PR048_027093 [Dryococelus australis]|uniref:Uncharacterized protein n=1 Tax=Dryococelus australis TaxID=614101 RepID=A0ABQ9GGH8_9NEOP|nr:hypothetical protein PR048_027093 [Dryococelus australis]
MIHTMSNEKFLTNPKNKGRLISMMISRYYTQASKIRRKRLDCQHCFVLGSIKMRRKDAVSPAIFSPANAGSSTVVGNILFLHAMSGCDTSTLFMQGKMKSFKNLVKDPLVAEVVKVFKDSNATQEMVAAAGERFVVSLCGYSGTNKSAFRYSSNIAALPPSAAAARKHSLRVNHQVQRWLGVEKNAKEWGWKKTNTGLEPVFTVLPPAPPTLLKLVSCECTKKCQRNCRCK